MYLKHMITDIRWQPNFMMMVYRYRQFVITLFLFLKSVPEITMRTLDCVEESFHSKHILFQADQCVTKLEIQNKIIVYKNLSYQYPVYFGYE